MSTPGHLNPGIQVSTTFLSPELCQTGSNFGTFDNFGLEPIVTPSVFNGLTGLDLTEVESLPGSTSVLVCVSCQWPLRTASATSSTLGSPEVPIFTRLLFYQLFSYIMLHKLDSFRCKNIFIHKTA
jgi:hypothetical protein